MLERLVSLIFVTIVGTLSNYDGNAMENVT